MQKQHNYQVIIQWTGNRGTGTDHFQNYDRSHTIKIEHKPDLPGSSDTAFRGDKTKHNPEDLLLSSVSACHMLWYLHLCADAGVIVVDYSDDAGGIMIETPGGGGRFTEITLNPVVTVTSAEMCEQAVVLHHKAHELCFISNSVNFPVYQKPVIKVKAD